MSGLQAPMRESVLEYEAPRKNWWRPAILTLFPCGALLALIFGFAVTTEALYQLSKARDGLFDELKPGLERFLWASVFPAFVFAFGIAIQTFDSAVRAVELLTAFSQDPQPASRFVTYNPLCHTTVTVVWHTLLHCHGQSVAMLSAASVFLLPLLKIGVAGLFVDSTTLPSDHISVHPTSGFNTTLNAGQSNVKWIYNQGTYTSAGTTVLLTQISAYGLPFPAWTTIDYAIGEAELSHLVRHDAYAEVRVRLPVMYPEASGCTIVGEDDYWLARGTDGSVSVQWKVSGGLNATLIPVMDKSGYFGAIQQPFGDVVGFQFIFGRTNDTQNTVERLVIGQCNASMVRCETTFDSFQSLVDFGITQLHDGN
jgi:hypothetical protein